MDICRKGPVATNGMSIQVYPCYPCIFHSVRIKPLLALAAHQIYPMQVNSEAPGEHVVGVWLIESHQSVSLCTGNRATDWLVEEVGGISRDIFRNSLDMLSNQHRCKQCKHLCEASPQSNILTYVILCNINVKFG